MPETEQPRAPRGRRRASPEAPKPPPASKLSEKRLARMVEALEAGATWRLAATAGGISEDTLLRWRQNDAAIAERLRAARDRGAIECLQIIREAAKNGDWRAAKERLVFIMPEDYGKNRHEFSGPGGSPIPVTVEGAEPQIQVTVDLADAVGRDPEALDSFLAWLGRRVGDRARPSESRSDAPVGDKIRP